MKAIIHSVFLLATMLFSLSVLAKEWIVLDFDVPGSGTGKVEALLRKPATDANGKALLLLHHAGGFSAGTTNQYADLFSSRGFTTLELKMFDSSSNRAAPSALYGMMAAGLKYLSQQPGIQVDKVSAMGLSFGAFMTISATTRWFYDAYHLGPLRFDRLAAVYPACWNFMEAIDGRLHGIRPFAGLPNTFFQAFTGIPLLILAGGKDSYEGGNPDSCPTLAKSIPDSTQAKLTQVIVYPDATHAWDHGNTYGFWAEGACFNRSSCRIHNVFSWTTTETGKRDLLEFFTRP